MEGRITPAMREAIGLLTADDVAELLQMSRDWVYDQASRDKIPNIKLGRKIRFRASELQAYLDGTWQPQT